MRLTEQAKILKEEIRRLERNVIREKETQNMEYLKNILMKVSIYEHLLTSSRLCSFQFPLFLL